MRIRSLLIVPLASIAVLSAEPLGSVPVDDPNMALMNYYLFQCDSIEPDLITFDHVIGMPDWFVARVDFEYDWWGTYAVFRWDRDGDFEVVEPVLVEGEPWLIGQYVSEISYVEHSAMNVPVIYVIDSTHQGNRFIYFMRLEPETGLIPLCRARLVLNTDDGAYSLAWSLVDENGDGLEDLLLEGIMAPLYEPWETGPTEESIRKVYLFDPEIGVFRLDMTRSEGVGPWDSLDSGYAEDDWEVEIL